MNTKSFLQKLSTVLLFSALSMSANAANSIVNVDLKKVGQYASMALDAKGVPIISYYSAEESTLKVAHCLDTSCKSVSSIETPDTSSQVGQYTWIALDHSGNPVISYYDIANTSLKVLHCGNAACSTGNTIATADSSGTVGQHTSVTVDAKNFPIVSYYDATNGILKILHCGNAACTSGNVIVTPDTATKNGSHSSIKLDSSGNPIVAYYNSVSKSLKILHCGDANCKTGNSIVTADSGGDVGSYPSMTIDGSGFPAVSYLDLKNRKLKLLRCGNALCSANNTVTTPIATNGTSGYYSSIAIPANNNPVVSYYSRTAGNLYVLSCANASCSSAANTLTIPDCGSVGGYTTLALDSSGNPVISYYDFGNKNLKLIHCGSATCSDNSDVIADPGALTGQYNAIKLDASGNPVISYLDATNSVLKVIHCGNSKCSANNSITSPYSFGSTGLDTSLALDANGYPVISFYDATVNMMNVLHCSDANCAGTVTINQPDTSSLRYSSLVLDADGFPVVASAGELIDGLRIVHCADVNCANNNVISTPDVPVLPDTAQVVGISMVLDSSGNPVVSFYRADTTQLKLLHCTTPACTGTTNVITILDVGAQASDHRSTSLTLDASGNPVIAYQDVVRRSLKVLHCGNTNCTSGNTIAAVAIGPNTGSQPSIKLDSKGFPVVSYGAAAGLTVIHCGNAVCTAGNTVAVGDAAAPTGWDSGLALDSAGKPVVSYYNGANLKVLHCNNVNCN